MGPLLLLLVLLSDRVFPQKVCSYQDILDSLNLSRGSEQFTSTRPVLDHTHRTVVHIDIALYAILAVVEKTQTFTPFIWVVLKWNNERVSWDPSEFCGITKLSLPKEMLWRPDLMIMEMTEMDSGSKSRYVYISYDGTVSSEEDLRVVSTCRMDVHKFPFDTQSCNITVNSAMHGVSELRLVPSSNSSRITQFSRRVMQTQGEWDFLGLAVTRDTFKMGDGTWDQIIYTISMRRRPLLHVINFLLPVFFFLCLDLSSFLISDHRGDKLGFKVTVLLAISVLLLILNEILPSMSNRTPLIATYCIVIFALMLLSLLETVVVTHLMERDSPDRGGSQGGDALQGADPELQDGPHSAPHPGRSRACCACVCDWSNADPPPDHHRPMAEQVNAGISHAAPSGIPKHRRDGEALGGSPTGPKGPPWVVLLEEVRAVKGLALAWDRQTHGYWTRVAHRINLVFFIFYLAAILLFLTVMYKEWQA